MHVFLIPLMLSSVCQAICGTTTTAAVIFQSVEKGLTVSWCQALCMNSVLQKTEKQNPGSARTPLAPACWCTQWRIQGGQIRPWPPIEVVNGVWPPQKE